MGVAVVGGEAGDDEAGGSPVAVSADPSVRGRARNPRITKWISIATNVPELSIAATYSTLLGGFHTALVENLFHLVHILVPVGFSGRLSTDALSALMLGLV